VIVPGNVHNSGTDAPDIFDANTPHNATNPLGRIRTEMEAAYRDSGVRTIILRAGDFIDTQASGNWFDKVMTPKLDKGPFGQAQENELAAVAYCASVLAGCTTFAGNTVSVEQAAPD
jgi:hypothetical protein